MKQLPDHPAIRYAERTGYPDASYLDRAICPMCDMEAETLYVSVRYGDTVGCTNCISPHDAWEMDT